MAATSLESKLDILRDRAHMLFKSREYFSKKNVLEVDCPILSKYAPIDQYIDVMKVKLPSETRYLHTSPEYPMKRLLSLGAKDIYQISHVFREGEVGHLHNPEFMMVEWYRLGVEYLSFIEETLEYIDLFLPNLPKEQITYRQAFEKYLQINPLSASNETLIEKLSSHKDKLPKEYTSWDRDTLLQMLMTYDIEPHLGHNAITVLNYYPPSQAALARTEVIEGDHVAKRFEIYYKGVELANGYHELIDPIEQEKRLIEEDNLRQSEGKDPLPVDPHFLQALREGLPDSCGVAIGFDRLMLLRHELSDIRDMLLLHWGNS